MTEPRTPLAAERYTTTEIEEVGRLLGDNAMETVERAALGLSQYGELRWAAPPLTRRQRLWGRLRDYRWRVTEAVAVLRGIHD